MYWDLATMEFRQQWDYKNRFISRMETGETSSCLLPFCEKVETNYLLLLVGYGLNPNCFLPLQDTGENVKYLLLLLDRGD
jgi:hypothetical protein